MSPQRSGEGSVPVLGLEGSGGLTGAGLEQGCACNPWVPRGEPAGHPVCS